MPDKRDSDNWDPSKMNVSYRFDFDPRRWVVLLAGIALGSFIPQLFGVVLGVVLLALVLLEYAALLEKRIRWERERLAKYREREAGNAR